MYRLTLFSLLISFYLLSFTGNAQTTRYVRPTATGDGSGSSWENASNDLQLMINQSSSGDRVLVAGGVYVPERRANNYSGTKTPNNTDNAFVLKAGVAVYGGFDPADGSDISNRSTMPGKINHSILSGDMDLSGGTPGSTNYNSGNASHVVIIAGGSNYTLDGFVIQRGNADAPSNQSITVNGYTVAKSGGGGIYITNEDDTVNGIYINNCWIRGNTGNMGAGTYTSVSAFFTNCVFSGNYSQANSGSGSSGAGLYNTGAMTGFNFGTYLSNCTFSGNRATQHGGAVYNRSKVHLFGIIIYNNDASSSGKDGIENNGNDARIFMNGTNFIANTSSSMETMSGASNMTGNPQFVSSPPNANAPFITGDYNLKSSSGAINTGNNTLPGMSPDDIDMSGKPRVQFGSIDLGAIESAWTKPRSIVYVKETKTGTGDGSSWANATDDIQAAISASSSQVWVAEGTYKPNRRADNTGTITPNNRNNAFVHKNNIKIYGGFGGMETSLSQRLLSPGNASILSGDFNGNDHVTGSGGNLNITGNGENAYHVVVAAGHVGTSTLDGFTITGGNASSFGSTITVNDEQVDQGQGGGFINEGNNTVAIANCIFTGNSGGQGGALTAMGSTGANIILTNSVFSRNKADYGGAFFLYDDTQLINCTVGGNKANNAGFVNVSINGIFVVKNTVVAGNNSGITINSGTLTINSSLIQGQTTNSGGNIDGSINPMFVNASGGDFSLAPCSPIINAGNNSYIPSSAATDIAGNTRKYDGTVDIGAYEYQSAPGVSPPTADFQWFCMATVADLIAGGENLKYYDVAVGGTPLPDDTELTSGDYYVSQTIDGCESARTEFNVSVLALTPGAPSPQDFSVTATVSDLEATGQNLQWYDVEEGGSPLDMNTIITAGTYYVTATLEYFSCEGARVPVEVTTSYPVRYVKSAASGSGDGSSWENASDDLQAMINASESGNTIFVAGGTYKPNRKANALETITLNNRDNAFVLKNGVKIYGNFAGTETSLAERDLSVTANKSILSGDFNDNDVVSGIGNNLSISGNPENARHVIIAAGDLGEAVLDGFTITGGHSNGSNITVNGKSISTQGAGLYNIDASPLISNCVFFGNHAHSGRGGGMFVKGSSPVLINNIIVKNITTHSGGGICYEGAGASNVINCVFWGNKAGASGGGILVDGSAPVLTNCTIVGNKGAAGGVYYDGSYTRAIHNSIIYGNTANVNGSGGSITNSLVQGITSTDNGNIPGNTNPLFVDSENGDFRLQLLSSAKNTGNNSYLPANITTDIVGNIRIQDCAVDMGAYESSPLPAPVVSGQSICTGNTIEDMLAEEENLQWYDVAEGGEPLTSETILTTRTYYVSQIINDCESPRTEVNVIVYNTPAPEAESSQYFCVGATLTELAAEGENLQWYDVPEDGEPLALDTILTTGTYYVSQILNGCESERAEVNASIIAEAPEAPSPQNFSVTTTVSDLEATGQNLQWYDAEEGGTPFDTTMVITLGTYYVSQTIDGCESSRTPVEVTTSYAIRYVKPTASGSGDGSSWENASDDLQAMINASDSGNTIFVAGGTYKPNRKANALETITLNNRDNSFVLKNDVKIYGNFAGTEISLEERDLSDSANKSILSGDFNGNDVVSGMGNNLSISGNTENARHVIIAAGDLGEAVLDGFIITGGRSNGSNITVNGKSISTQGAGLYNIDASPLISNCTFFGNNAAGRGGGMFIKGSSPVLINNIIAKNITGQGGGGLCYQNAGASNAINCVFWGNRANGSGGGILVDGSAPVLTNCTIVGNKGAAGGVYYGGSNYVRAIHNSIIYGNNANINGSGGSITNSLVQGITSTANGNINGNTNPLFADSENGDFSLQLISPVINKGDNSYVSGVDTDIVGNDRIQLGIVDLGAYESERNGVIWTIDNEWLNNIEPDEEKEVFIEGILNVGTDYESFSAKTLTVEEGGSMTIDEGNSVTVLGRIINNSGEENFIVESDGNLIQVEDVENTGEITVRRNSTPMMRLDYALWSSPVDGQGIHAFSPETVASRIYTYEGEDSYQLVPDLESDFIAGKGYMFRAPNNWNITTDANYGNPVAYPGEFKGVPFNGDISIAVHPGSYTSIGNPYPSNIELGDDPSNPENNTFLNANPEVGTIYFWTNTYGADGEGGYTGNNWATYTFMGGTSAGFESDGVTPSEKPNGYINPGQGFIINSTESGTSISFNNTMRTSEEAIFFKNEEEETSRFWLNLDGTESENYNQILTGYMAGATLGIDNQIDGKMFGYEGSAIYNLIDDASAGSIAAKFTIQGRPLPFEVSDVVPLGFRAIEGGKFRISLSNYEGIFSEGEITIFIKDKALHQIHNLMESAYEFESEAGEFNDRFEIIYEDEGTMATDDQTSNTIRIYTDNDYIVVDSETEKILSVELYDLSGRNLYRDEKVNANHYRVKSAYMGTQVLIVKARAANGKIVTKKVINK